MSRGDDVWHVEMAALGAHEAESRPFLDAPLDCGITFFDTADMYSRGVSEEVLGRALKDLARASKSSSRRRRSISIEEGTNAGGLSRKHLMHAIDGRSAGWGWTTSISYQIHRFDYVTPIAETLEALHDIVKAGKAATSAHRACRMAIRKMLFDRRPTAGRVSSRCRIHHNLLYREEEREMLPLCAERVSA